MEKDDSFVQDDSLGIGRGMVYGVVLGGLMWAGIIGLVVWWLR